MPRITHGFGGDTAADDAPLLGLFEVLGQRWSLRVIWELRTDSLTYRQLASRIPDMSTSVLTQRLRDLRSAGLVEHERGAGYRLSGLGRELRAHLERLGQWARRVDFTAEMPER